MKLDRRLHGLDSLSKPLPYLHGTDSSGFALCGGASEGRKPLS
jgi:hypothetical protein